METAGNAAARATPAEIAWTTADARGVGGNRHAAGGLTDPEVGILAVRRAGGGPLLAAALVYGMHPTVLHEDSAVVSADFPHFARQHLRERFGEPSDAFCITWGPAEIRARASSSAGRRSPKPNGSAGKLGQAAAASLERQSAADFDQDASCGAAAPHGRPAAASHAAGGRRTGDPGAVSWPLPPPAAVRVPTRPRSRTAECAVFGARERSRWPD